MGADRGDVQGPGGVLTLGGVTDHKDDSEERVRKRLVVTLSSGGYGSRGDPPYHGVHQEVEGNHSRKDVLLPHL